MNIRIKKESEKIQLTDMFHFNGLSDIVMLAKAEISVAIA